MAWSYREAEITDVPRLQELYVLCRNALWYCTSNLEGLEAGEIAKLVTGKHLHTVVLEEDGTVIAFVSMWTPKEPIDLAFGDALAIDLVRYAKKREQSDVIGRVLTAMWRMMKAKGRTKTRANLRNVLIPSVGLVRGLRAIAEGLPAEEGGVEVDVDDGIAWGTSEGY